ncbi:glycosyltransferase family 25 protein [Mesorhizobium sp. 10J20-29]
MINTYVINLDRASERLAYMQRQLDALSLPYERVDAIDGSQLMRPVAGFDERGYQLLHGRKFNPGEVGCYLSHMQALRKFMDSGADHCLILEDDCLLPPDLSSSIEKAIAAADDWDILRLSTVSSGRKFAFRSIGGGCSLAISLTREKGSGAYVVSRRCAETFLRRLRPMRMAWDIAFDTEYLMGLRSVFLLPLPVNQVTDIATQIQVNHRKYKLPRWRYLTVFPWRVWVEVNRVLHRGWRLLILKSRYRET